MKKVLFSLVVAIFSTSLSFAQSINPSIINTNGGSTVIAGNTYEWSIGEMVLVNTVSAGSVIVTQGLLQPNKPSSGSAINESQFIFDHVSVYPNPTENLFYLSTDFHNNGKILSTLYDLNGKIIMDNETLSKGQQLKIPFNISNLSAGNYMLIVSFVPENGQGKFSKAAYKIEKSN